MNRLLYQSARISHRFATKCTPEEVYFVPQSPSDEETRRGSRVWISARTLIPQMVKGCSPWRVGWQNSGLGVGHCNTEDNS